MARDATVRLKITNALQEPRTVVLEPWTTEISLAPGASCEVVATGDVALPLEVELHGTTVTVYSFDSAGATASIVPLA